MPETLFQLYSGPAPDARGEAPEDVPTIQWIKPHGTATGAAMIVCPGGGYGNLAAHEGVPVAERLSASGIAGFVLKYRHSAAGYRHPTPLGDLARAIRTVRARAREFGVDPNRIGVLGFSAGGHLSATISNHFDEGDPASADPIQRVSSRPDVAVLMYPVITMCEPHLHAGSRLNLLGPDFTPEMCTLLSLEQQVTAKTPPTFLFHTFEDQPVPVENVLMYAAALRKAGVPFDLHIFEKGRHGVGLAPDFPTLAVWPDLLVNWLKERGFTK